MMMVTEQEQEKELRKECREGLHYIKKRLKEVDDDRLPEGYKATNMQRISDCLYFFTHGIWPSEMLDRPENPPIGHFHNRICVKFGGGAKEAAAIMSIPRMRPWIRREKYARDQLNSLLYELVTYNLPVPHQPQWSLPWYDTDNDHPDAVKWREGKAERKKEFADDAKKRRHARAMAESRKKERLEKESKERAKTKEKTRKDRAKHFKKLKEEGEKKSGN